MFGPLPGCYTIYTFSLALAPKGILPSKGILPGGKFTLLPSLALSYIGSVTARRLSSEHQPNFVAWYLHILMRQGGHPIRHWVVEMFSYYY